MPEAEDTAAKYVKLPAWKAQGPDAVIVARSFWAGDLDDTIGSWERFLEVNPTITHKYRNKLEKGKRNLRKNVLKLIRKIELWRDNKPDPKTGSCK